MSHQDLDPFVITGDRFVLTLGYREIGKALDSEIVGTVPTIVTVDRSKDPYILRVVRHVN